MCNQLNEWNCSLDTSSPTIPETGRNNVSVTSDSAYSDAGAWEELKKPRLHMD